MRHAAVTVAVIFGTIVFYLLSPPFVVWLFIRLPGGFSPVAIEVLSFVYTPARILASHSPLYLELISTESNWLRIYH